VPFVVDELLTLARTLIAVDNTATGAVHDVFPSAPDLCAEIAMPNDQISKRAKGQQ